MIDTCVYIGHNGGPMGPAMRSNQQISELLAAEDIIIACATPSSLPMGISILRISGTFNVDYFGSIIIKSGPIGPRHAALVSILDPLSKVVLDKAIMTYFPGPKSFTGEDVLEISLHGNPRLVDRVIEVFIENFSLRLAEPGEFTLRAFRNKKLTMSQVEGLDQLLNATTQPLLELSQKMLAGGMQQEFLQLKSHLDIHQAAIDLMTDFSEDVGAEAVNKMLYDSWLAIDKLVDELYARCKTPLDHLLKPTIVLYGPPNAGKSTLFNNLLGYSRSIVSEMAGTTRDYVTDSLFIENSEFSLTDTAGIRTTNDNIEGQGIFFTKKMLQAAFIRVLVISAADLEGISSYLGDDQPHVLVITHTDTHPLPANFSSTNPIEFVSINMSNDAFIGQLKAIFSRIYASEFSVDPIIVSRQRHEIIDLFLKKCDYSTTLRRYASSDAGIISYEFSRLKIASSHLLGITDVDEVLNYVFANFCIGK